jgi:hypothetical protein
MKILLSILLIGSGLSESAHAFSPDFHFGVESDFSRPVVTPSTFSFFKTGIDASSENYQLDLELKMSFEHSKANALSSKNAFYQFIGDETFKLSLGRKWTNWSQLDENWGLGAFNALDSWDRLRSFSQGLTGLFMSVENEFVHFDFFASYLMLPEITPNVVIENNRFEFYHPQSVSAGPQTFELLNRPTPLGYNLRIPEISSILLRPSVAFSLETKKHYAPFFAKISYGYLPLNYFPMALQASLAIPIDEIVVDLRPRLLSHNLYNAEVAYEWNPGLIGGLSLTVDQIVSEEFIPADYTTAQLGTTTYFSPWIKIEIFKISHLYSQGGISTDIGPYANSSHNLFSSRILYRNATQLQISLSEITAKLLHEFSIEANWIAIDWKHQWNKKLSTTLGADILSAEAPAASNGGAEFISDLRALDRIRLGVNYVF